MCTSSRALAVLFVDLKNAFPTTNLPTLWLKYHNAGARGPMFDWMRSLYRGMEYRVRLGDEISEPFQSKWGILAGDSASPSLFCGYMHDYNPPVTVDDLIILLVIISVLVFADDIAKFLPVSPIAPDLHHLQTKLDYTEKEFCARSSFLELNADKSKLLLIGARNPPIAPLTVENGTRIVETVDSFVYSGITFSSDIRNVFSGHYTLRAKQAQNAVYAVFASEAYVGSLSVVHAVRIYYARVDPYLIHGYEAIVDIKESDLRKLQKVQIGFLRRLLGLHPRCPLALLFTETGIMPIRHRRLILSLKYAKHTLEQSSNHFANVSFRDSRVMHSTNRSCFVGDLVKALKKLPDFHVDVDVRSFETVEGIDNLIECVQEACARHLASGISSERTPLLNPILRGLKEDSIQSVIVLRKYFKFITVSSHRKALSRLLSADHFLAVERYRHITYDNGQPIPRCERRCRYCRVCVEDEVHVLFHCSALQLLVARRQKLFARVNVLIGETAGNDLRHLCLSDSPRAVHRFLDHPDLCPTFAKYVFDILKFFPL